MVDLIVEADGTLDQSLVSRKALQAGLFKALYYFLVSHFPGIRLIVRCLYERGRGLLRQRGPEALPHTAHFFQGRIEAFQDLFYILPFQGVGAVFGIASVLPDPGRKSSFAEKSDLRHPDARAAYGITLCFHICCQDRSIGIPLLKPPQQLAKDRAEPGQIGT